MCIWVIELELRQYNVMQCELIKSSGLTAEIWIKNYSAKFRELVNAGMTDIEKIRLSLYI